MGRKCSVENCFSDSTKPEHTGVTFHKVPLHADIRPKWLSLCRISNDKTINKLLYVCSRHFLRADFCNFKGKKYMLKQGVLPSVFPWDKSKLEAIKAVVKKEPENFKKKDVDMPKKRESTRSKKKEVKTNEAPSTEDETTAEPEEVASEPYHVDTLKEDPQTKFDAFDQHQTSQTASPVCVPISFTINSQIEVLDNNSIWHTAKISEVDYEENEVLIHFEKSLNKCDEWISMSSPRLRSIQAKLVNKFEIGERCMATWSDSRKFPATVTKILENDLLEVLFDDGFTKTIKRHKLSKMSTTKPPQSSPLFEPVKSTKQERRDKKRKLNVADLFPKRPRLITSEDKRGKSSPKPSHLEETCSSPASQDENISSPVHPQWHPTWENGKPIGIESTIEGMDGYRKSTIVPDPRLPAGWTKHLVQRIYGNSVGKWDTIILAPDGKKFRSKQEVKNYLDLHPTVEASIEMFDFSLFNRRKSGKITKHKHNVEPCNIEVATEALQVPDEPPLEKIDIKDEVQESATPTLKIIFENDSYKCPIDGCGKNFRRENLALMHVKHYHSEYTKYLDFTPNVADLAYARTVGENLDRSPGPGKSVFLRTERISGTPKIPKDSAAKSPGLPDTKAKDAEIIKLLNQKTSTNDSQPLPSGIKTILPIRSAELSEDKPITKRKKYSTLLDLETSKERMKQEEIINCTCGFTEEDGLMIQCELCLCWQHAYCNNIQKESEVPEKYVCYICQHPYRERPSAKYLHDQDWLKQGILPVGSYHSKDKQVLDKRFEKLKKCHDISGGLVELKEYLHTLAVKLKIAESKNHPKLYLWSKPWEKPKIPVQNSEIKVEKDGNKDDAEAKTKMDDALDHQYVKNDVDVGTRKVGGPNNNDSMLMMILKSDKEDTPMLNSQVNLPPIIPMPEEVIDSDDCKLNLLDHIAHGEHLVEERLNDFEKQLEALEEGMNLETDEDYPRTRQTLQMLIRDLETLKKFSELPIL
ncbi:hypothetical protein ABEB36_011932 [Hypothenemus hampei]|uniref:PHD finger protein 20 n=1 Tax=Hypothenemus hampei TaxID=57062 RepID=A0ABD1E9H1_HYPHA